MLKIKDNVDLKELEKFGFDKSKIANETYYIDETYKSDNEYCPQYTFSLIINWRNSKVKNSLVGGFNANDDEIDEIFDLDILYDLIKANLIEKVDIKGVK